MGRGGRHPAGDGVFSFGPVTLSNAQIGELLALAAEEREGTRQRAYRRASRAAFTWPREAADMIEADISPTELRAIGPRLGGLIRSWVETPPEVPEPPPIRSGFMTLAEAHRVIDDAGERAPVPRGDLQMHTRDSDGRASIEEMALAGAALGYEYVAITDHSKGLKIAGGMDEARLAQQAMEIDAANAWLAGAGKRVTILRALEMNLDPAGQGDMEPASLANLDLVLGSFHSKLRVKEDQTDRYLTALRNPMIDVLGHPRGRIYNFRLGLTADWLTVFAAAAARGKAVEIDCYPDRQDLDVSLLRKARDAGVMISLGTDAHNQQELSFMPIGVASLIKAGIPEDRILNLMPAADIVAWAGERRRASLGST